MYSLLARQKKELEEYSKKPEASIKAIEYRTELITRLLAFVQTAEILVTQLTEDIEYEYKRGFVNGLDRARNETKPNRYYDSKETIRAYHNTKQYQKWSDHL